MEQNTINYQLIAAVRGGDLEATRKLINSHGLFHSRGCAGGYNLLREAVLKVNAHMVKLLLELGARVNRRCESFADTLLHIAVTNQNIKIATMLLNKGASLNTTNGSGSTPLHCAIENDEWSMTKVLLNHNPDVNIRNHNGNTLLNLAAVKENLEIVRLLLSKGAHVERDNENGMFPLHIAAKNKCFSICEELLNNGASVNLVTSDGYVDINIRYLKKEENKRYSPLHFAVESGCKEIVALLISKGAIIDMKGTNDITPLHIAAKYGCSSIAEELLNQGASLNSATLAEGYTPLHFAVKRGNNEVSLLLLSRGCNNDMKGANGETPLHIAAENGNKVITKVLLEQGANINSVTLNQETPLYFACHHCNVDLIELFLNLKADVNARTAENLEPIFIAIKKCHAMVVKLLLEHGVQVDKEDKDGKTVLFQAVESGHLATVEQILKFDPDIYIASNKNALKSAVYGGKEEHKKMVTALVDYGLSVNPSEANNCDFLHTAIGKGYLKVVEDLLKYGANVNNPCLPDCKNKFNPLHTAVKREKTDVVELLVSYKADVNVLDEKGQTPMHYAFKGNCFRVVDILLSNGAHVNDINSLLITAVSNFHKEMVEVLLKHNANVNAMDEDGNSALHCCMAKNQSERPVEKIAQFLLSKGARVNAQNKRGLTPLHMTVGSRFNKTAELLLEHGAEVDKMDQSGRTALYCAVSIGAISTVDIILKYRPDVNLESNKSSLVTAILQNEEINSLLVTHPNIFRETIEKLLNYGFSINATDANNFELFRISVEKGYLNIVEDFFKFGANLQCPGHKTLLHVAIKNKQDEVVKLLIRNNADINFIDDNGRSPIYYAVMNNLLTTTEALLANQVNISGNPNLLILATRWSDPQIVELLLKYEFDVNARDESGYTALSSTVLSHSQSIDGQIEIIEMLLEKGANIKALNENGETALHLSIKMKNKTLVEMLLQQGASINNYDEYGQTILKYWHNNCDSFYSYRKHTKYSESYKSIMAYVLDHSSQRFIESMDTDCKRILWLLHKYGLQVEQTDASDSDLFQAVVEHGNVNLAEEFLKVGAEVNVHYNQYTLLHIAVNLNYCEMVKLLLRYNANVNELDYNGKTPVHYAVIEGFYDITNILIANGAIVSNNPELLHIAAVGNLKICELLLNKGININIKDEDENTPLHNAIKQHNSSTTELLLMNGADINVVNKSDKTPVNVATDNLTLKTDYFHTNLRVKIVQNDRHKILLALLRYIAKSKLTNFYICDRNYELINKNKAFQKYLQKCEDELVGMMNMNIADSSVSFFDILTKGNRSLVTHLKNESILMALNSNDHSTQFPNYSNIITARFELGKARLEKSQALFQFLTDLLPALPHSCIDHIISFLTIDTLKYFFENL